MPLFVDKKRISSIVACSVLESAYRSHVASCFRLWRCTLQMSCNQFVALCKPLHVAFTKRRDQDSKHRFARGQNTIFTLATCHQNAYRCMFVGVTLDNLSHNDGDITSRIGNIQVNDFSRAIETVQM